MIKRFLTVAVIVTLAGSMSPARADDDNMDALIDLLRSDVQAERMAIITEVMDFTDKEAAAFWPIYQEYVKEQRKINDSRVDLIKQYAENYYDMDDATAGHIAKTWIDLDIKEGYLKKKYLRKFEWALSTIQAAKFLQLDGQISLLIRLQVAAELPMLEEWK